MVVVVEVVVVVVVVVVIVVVVVVVAVVVVADGGAPELAAARVRRNVHCACSGGASAPHSVPLCARSSLPQRTSLSEAPQLRTASLSARAPDWSVIELAAASPTPTHLRWWRSWIACRCLP